MRHVAGHLLDTALRRLTIARDGVVFGRPASAAPDDLRMTRLAFERLGHVELATPLAPAEKARAAAAFIGRYLVMATTSGMYGNPRQGIAALDILANFIIPYVKDSTR